MVGRAMGLMSEEETRVWVTAGEARILMRAGRLGFWFYEWEREGP
jgi:hypothetical protein